MLHPFATFELPVPGSIAPWTGLLLHLAHEQAGRVYAHAMAPLGLKPTQVGVLQWLGGHGPTAQARLGEWLHIDKATMVFVLNDLASHGLIERRPHATDRRAFEVHLTATGRTKLAEAEHATASVEDAYFGVLTAVQRDALRMLLQQVVLAHDPAALG